MIQYSLLIQKKTIYIDSNGVQQFAFHANINHPIKGKEDGTISREVGYAQNGIWEIRDPNIQLKVGDELYYWIFVQHNRLGFDRQEQKFKVTGMLKYKYLNK